MRIRPRPVSRLWSRHWRRSRAEAASLSARLSDAEAGRLAGQQHIAALKDALAAAVAKARVLAVSLAEAEAGRTEGRDEIAGLRQTLAEDAETAQARIAALEQALAAVKDAEAAFSDNKSLSARLGPA